MAAVHFANWKGSAGRGLRTGLCACLLALAAAAEARAEAGEAWDWSEHLELGFSDRLRFEGVNWFQPPSGGGIDRDAHHYVFGANRARLAAQLSFPSWQAVFELQDTRIFGLPDDATLGAPFGALGPGAVYFAHTAQRNQGELAVKQGYLTLRHSGVSLTGGRFEHRDGLESVPGHRTLAWLKKSRIAERLVGPFGYTHVGRAFDGFRVAYDDDSFNTTLFGARPTRGGFEVSANRGLDDVGVGVASFTWKRPPGPVPLELRAFYLYYQDGRDDPTKVDNRPPAARAADGRTIALHTGGGHVLAVLDAGPGEVDLLGWFAIQGGDWGRLDHFAWAYALEAGYRLPRLPAQPWLRVGWNRSSGDDDPGDGDHESFFQVLPTARVYARFPFFNLMNSSDVFAQLILDPHRWVRLRLDYHWLRLAERGDLWYAGGGASNEKIFGFGGLASGGDRDLAHLLDLGVSLGPWQPHEDFDLKLSVELYYGHAFGGSVVRNAFADAHADYGFAELTLRY